MRISTAMRKPPQLSLQAKALNILKNNYAKSPASIFVPGSGYLQALDNKLTYSKDFTNAAWTKPNITLGAPVADPLGGMSAVAASIAYSGVLRKSSTPWTAGTVGTVAFWVRKSNTGGATHIRITTNNDSAWGTGISQKFPLTTDWQLLTLTGVLSSSGTLLSVMAGSFDANAVTDTDCIGNVEFYSAGLFAGTYSQSQVASLGIPWTMASASVSLSLGPELVTNGGFGDATGWTVPPGWGVASGVATAAATSSSLLQTGAPLSAGKTYRVSFDWTHVSGTLYVRVGGGTATTSTSSGSKSVVLETVAADGVEFYGGAVSGTLDNVSVRQILSVACPVYTNAHVYLPGSTVTTYGANIAPAIDNTWSVTNAGWGNVGSTAVATAVPDGNAFYKIDAVAIGKTYQYTLTVSSISAGAMLVYIGGNGDGKTITAPGTLTGTIQATLNTNANIGNSGTTTGVVSSLVLREVITTSSVTAGLLSNNYTLSDGSTGYSAVDGTAGLVLDGMGATVQYNPATVPTNSYGGTGASTVVRTGASLTFTSAPSGDDIRLVPVYGVSDKFSYVKFTASGSGQLTVYAGGTPATFTLTGTPTQYQCGTAGNSSDWLIFRSNSAGMSASITINEISGSSGIHATQATTANKPALRRGLLNVLKQSNTFTDANWLKTNIAPTAGVADPFGGTAATTLTATAASGEIYQTAADAGKPYTSGIYIRRRTGSGAVNIRNAANTAWIPLSLTSAWQLLVNDGGTTTANWYFDLQISTSGDAVDVYGAIVSPGVLSAQQILAEGGIPLTTSAAASNAGAGRYWWQFDGSNDSLALAGANTGAQGAMIGAFRPNNAHFGSVFGSGGDTIGNPGCGIGVDSGSRASFLFGDGTTTNKRINSGATTIVGAAHVISAVWGTASQKLRVDGNQVGSGVEPVVPVSSDGISIGRIYASGDFFSGAVGPLISISGTVSDADLLTLERWVASQTPNGPVF